MRVLVTGASGFVGQALCRTLHRQGYAVRAAVREARSVCSGDAEQVRTGDVNSATDWRSALDGVGAVVHLAARVHVMCDRVMDPYAAYREVNAMGTLRLAEAAASARVRRVVYVSTVKVNGESTFETPFNESQPAAPQDPYAMSKWEAEQGLARVAARTGLEMVVVRPPLVYGPDVKGNFLSLMRMIYRGVPLPVGGCNNRRSLLGLDNLVDFLATCVDHPAAAGQTFVLSDGEDLSTPDLIRRLAAAMDRPARLLSVPPGILRLAARMLGRHELYQRVCGSLQVDSSHARRLLGWTPPESVETGLAATARTFLRQQEP